MMSSTRLKTVLDGETLQIISYVLNASTNMEGTFCRLKQNVFEMGMLPINTHRIIVNVERSAVSIQRVTNENISIVWNTFRKTRQLYLVQVSMTTYLIKKSELMDLLEFKLSQNERNSNVRHIDKKDLISFFNRKSICSRVEHKNRKRRTFNKNAEVIKSFRSPQLTKVYSTVRSEQPRPEHTTIQVCPETLSGDSKPENDISEGQTEINSEVDDINLHSMAYPLHSNIFKNPSFPSYDDEDNKRPVQATDADMGEMSLPTPSTSLFHHDYANSFVASGAAFKVPMKYPDFASYERRLDSFFNGQWSNNKPPPNELANLGLFLKEGEGDLTRCFQCGIGFKDWGESDDPLKERVKYSSDCPFLVKKIGQTKIDELKSAINNPDRTGQGPHDMKSPRYQTMQARISSFRDFPRSVNITPQQFAVAGLFYTGDADLCRCFTCDGGLKTWDVDDDPVVEHALYFPNCPYIMKLKGEAYIRMIQTSNSNRNATGSSSTGKLTSRENNGAGAMAGTSATTRLQVPGSTDSLEVNKKNMTMTSNTDEYSEHKISQMSQRLGFSESDVTRAIVELEIKGNFKPSTAEIMNMLLDIKEQDERHQEEKKHEAVYGKSVSTLVSENQMMSKQVFCMLCVTSEANVLFLPCTHHRLCTECAKEITNCPVCKSHVAERIRTYRA